MLVLDYYKKVQIAYGKLEEDLKIKNKSLEEKYDEYNKLLPYLESDVFDELNYIGNEDKSKYIRILNYNTVDTISVPEEIKNNKYEKIYRELKYSALEKVSNEHYDDIAYVSGDLRGAILALQWGYYKKVYSIDSDFYNSLVTTNKVKLYKEELKRLPYNSFYVDLSSVKFSYDSPLYDTMQGVFIHIYYDEDCVISENAPVIESSILSNSGGKYQTTVSFHLLNDSDDCYNLEVDIIDDEIDKFVSPLDAISIFSLQFILFLLSKNNDIMESNETKNTYKSNNIHTNKFSAIQKWDVGYRYGKQIRAYKEQKERGSILGVAYKDKNRPRPHTRQAHWHHYWCGSKEEKHLELRWIHPCFINGKEDDVITTINEVTNSKELKLSKGEVLVKSYLEKIGLDFEREYRVEIDGHIRRFDFMIRINNKIKFIEFDGEQHFKPAKRFQGKQGYINRHKIDLDKNKYAEDNHIPLLRIRYDQKAEIPQLINDFINNDEINKLNSLLSNEEYYSKLRKVD